MGGGQVGAGQPEFVTTVATRVCAQVQVEVADHRRCVAHRMAVASLIRFR